MVHLNILENVMKSNL